MRVNRTCKQFVGVYFLGNVQSVVRKRRQEQKTTFFWFQVVQKLPPAVDEEGCTKCGKVLHYWPPARDVSRPAGLLFWSAATEALCQHLTSSGAVFLFDLGSFVQALHGGTCRTSLLLWSLKLLSYLSRFWISPHFGCNVDPLISHRNIWCQVWKTLVTEQQTFAWWGWYFVFVSPYVWKCVVRGSLFLGIAKYIHLLRDCIPAVETSNMYRTSLVNMGSRRSFLWSEHNSFDADGIVSSVPETWWISSFIFSASCCVVGWKHKQMALHYDLEKENEKVTSNLWKM